jgi:hypothetical protein
MSHRVVLTNQRRFPRARLSCDIISGNRSQLWHSYTRDISLGGCRVAGYSPFSPGKPLALKMTHPSVPEPVAMVGTVVRLCGDVENAVGMVFAKQWSGMSKFEEWIRKVIANDPTAARTVAQTSDYLPLEAQLHRAPKPLIERLLLPGELALMQRLDRSTLPMSLIDLRTEWGDGWEQRAQVVFGLIAEGFVLCSMPSQPMTSPPMVIVPPYTAEHHPKAIAL